MALPKPYSRSDARRDAARVAREFGLSGSDTDDVVRVANILFDTWADKDRSLKCKSTMDREAVRAAVEERARREAWNKLQQIARSYARCISNGWEFEDVAGDAMQNLVAALERGTPVKSHVALLIRAVQCRARDIHRRSNTKTAQRQQVAEEVFSGYPAPKQRDPVVCQEAKDRLDASIEKLPTGAREVASLRIGLGISLKKISEILGISEDLAKHRNAYACTLLRGILGSNADNM